MQSREVPWSTILLFLVVQTALITVLVAWRMELLVPVARATGWLVQTDLLAGALLMLVVVGGILVGHGRLRPAELGLVRAHLPVALAVTAGFWLATQVVLVLASLLHTGSLVLHPQWHDPGTLMMLTFLAAMLLGTPLYEEVAFRGFLFPQLYQKIRGAQRARVALAGAASAALFALGHVPTRLLISQVTGATLLSHLAVLTLAGLFGVALYLRTGNLLVVTGIHALVNAPTQMVTAPISPFPITLVLSAGLWLAWPRFRRDG